jgi:trehalose monomycolate/heme transporter
MFLVPATMKLLGDDCWWAPRWMKRIQERLGLGETELPDERKRPAVRDSVEDERALVGAGAPAAPRPRPPHDPTHPAAEGSSRPGATTRIATPWSKAPSVAGTTRIPTGTRGAPADEPQTTRMSMARNAVRNVVNNAAAATQRNYRPTPPPPQPPPAKPPRDPQAPREEREIESWLGELRGAAPAGGKPAPPPLETPPEGRGRPSADATRAMPELGALPSHGPTREPGTGGPPAQAGGPARQPRPQPQPGNEPTTAIPTPRQQGTPPEGRGDPESTEKINTREDEERNRRGGGVSAQDLLRREGRL